MNKIFSQTLRRSGSLLAALFMLLQVTMPMTASATSGGGQEVCPNTGNGWVKVDGLSGLTYEYDVPEGYTVTDNCYKASTTVVYGTGPVVTSTVWNKDGCPEANGCNYQALSHASFKLVALPGSITIKKDAQPDSSQAFHFSTTGLSTDASGFDLVDDSTPGLPEKVFANLAPGTYTVGESQVAYWDLESISCSRGSNVTKTNTSVTINLAAGQNVTCTFTNQKVTPPPTEVPVPAQPASVDPCGPNNVVWVGVPEDTQYIDWAQVGNDLVATLKGDNVKWSDNTTAPKTYTLPADTNEACPTPCEWDPQLMANDPQCKEPKIVICHATAAVVNPYNKIEVNRSAADGLDGNSGGQPDHYGEHTGSIFDPATDENGDDWGDIIPPIPGVHDGLNWTAEGQAIYNNGDCDLPPPPVDVCPNIQGNQSTVPEGMVKDDSGNCVPPVEPCEWNSQIPADDEGCVPPSEGCVNLPEIPLLRIDNPIAINTDCTITGHKFNDANGNGEIDEDETEALSGFEFDIYSCSNPIEDVVDATNCEDAEYIETATSDENGSFVFNIETNGTYMVCEKPRDGWMQTLPANDACWLVPINDNSCEIVFGNKAKQPGEVLGETTPTPQVLTNTGKSTAMGIIAAMSIVGAAATIVTRRQQPNGNDL